MTKVKRVIRGDFKINFKKYSVDGRYSFLPADDDEQRNDDIAEWTLNQSFKVGENWQLSNSLRYDLQAIHWQRQGSA